MYGSRLRGFQEGMLCNILDILKNNILQVRRMDFLWLMMQHNFFTLNTLFYLDDKLLNNFKINTNNWEPILYLRQVSISFLLLYFLLFHCYIQNLFGAICSRVMVSYANYFQVTLTIHTSTIGKWNRKFLIQSVPSALWLRSLRH